MKIHKSMGFRAATVVALWLVWVGSATAIPSWMGVYGSIFRLSGDNPGTFTILMNQDYFGLQAEVGIQVNGGAWTTYPMTYAGRVDGNSKWTFSPSSAFPAGATVVYYFHGYDKWGGHIWDSDGGRNYRFTVESSSGLSFGAAVNIGNFVEPSESLRDASISGQRILALSGQRLNRGTVGVNTTTWSGWNTVPANMQSVAISGSRVVLAGNSGAHVLVHVSTNGGVSFGPATALPVNGSSVFSLDVGARGSEFVIVCAAPPSGDYVFNAHTLWSLRSTDGGQTWSPARPVDSADMGWMDDIDVEANGDAWYVKYRYVQQAYSTIIRAARSTDGQNWQVSSLFGDKAGSMSSLLVTPAGAFVAMDPYYHHATRLARFITSAGLWEQLSLAHPEGYSSGRSVELAAGPQGTLYFFRNSGSTIPAWSISKSIDQGWSWQANGSVTPPPSTNYVALSRVLSAGGNVHLAWSAYPATLWQVSRQAAGGPVYWCGNTRHSPSGSALTHTNELVVSVESWPASNAVSALITYTTGSTFFTLPMEPAGRVGNNDRWTVNLGMFAPGTTIRYAVEVTGGDGVVRRDNHGGNDYQATVNRQINEQHIPVFAALDPYRGDVERVRVNGRTRDSNNGFGPVSPVEPIIVTTRPAESSNGSTVQFGVALSTFLVYTTRPGDWSQAQLVYGTFVPGAFSNKPIFDFTTFNLGPFAPNTPVEFWLGAANSLGVGYAQQAGRNFSFYVR